MDEITVLKPCAICVDLVLYRGPSMLRAAKVFCSQTCAVIYDLITPGYWVDAAEIMPGGRFHDRPEIWADS
jgi:endogenous inhibitor of DNA gyrase (YacG/DUF329 family)